MTLFFFLLPQSRKWNVGAFPVPGGAPKSSAQARGAGLQRAFGGGQQTADTQGRERRCAARGASGCDGPFRLVLAYHVRD